MNRRLHDAWNKAGSGRARLYPTTIQFPGHAKGFQQWKVRWHPETTREPEAIPLAASRFRATEWAQYMRGTPGTKAQKHSKEWRTESIPMVQGPRHTSTAHSTGCQKKKPEQEGCRRDPKPWRNKGHKDPRPGWARATADLVNVFQFQTYTNNSQLQPL